MKLKNNTFFHRSFLAIVLTLFSLQLYGQIVFEENFNLPEGTTSGTADGVNWSSSCPTCLNGDHWEVKSGVFEGKDTNGEAVWATDTPIDISACENIEISFDINSIGTMEGCGTDCNSVDWVRFQYNIDGAGWVDPANSYYCSGTCAGINVVSSDDTPFTNYSTGCIPTGGSSLQLRISVQCWAADEAWQIDNIKVSCGAANAGENAVLNTCSDSPATDLFNQLGGNPINGGTWSGPSNLSGGDAGTFDPATMNEGTYTYTVGNSPCQASANVVVNFVSSGNAGNDATIEICNTSPSLNLFDVLGGAPQNNGVWSGPSALTGGDLGTFNPATMQTGDYTYTVGSAPCEQSAVVTVVTGGPTASFSANPTSTTVENTLVQFTNTSQNASSFVWDFGDDSPSTATINPSHNYPDLEQGIYTVTLTAYDANNCTDVTTAQITIVAPEMKYEIPNVFTPNGDNNNDFFKLIEAQNIESIELEILNRWGNVVFTSKDINFQWNGKINNEGPESMEGTYFYQLVLTDFNGKNAKEHGFLQLVRD